MFLCKNFKINYCVRCNWTLKNIEKSWSKKEVLDYLLFDYENFLLIFTGNYTIYVEARSMCFGHKNVFKLACYESIDIMA